MYVCPRKIIVFCELAPQGTRKYYDAVCTLHYIKLSANKIKQTGDIVGSKYSKGVRKIPSRLNAILKCIRNSKTQLINQEEPMLQYTFPHINYRTPILTQTETGHHDCHHKCSSYHLLCFLRSAAALPSSSAPAPATAPAHAGGSAVGPEPELPHSKK